MSNITNFINMVNNLNNINNILDRSFQEQTNKNLPCLNDFVEKLEKVTVSEKDIENNLSCAICQESFKLGEKIIKLPCKYPHFFHFEESEDECGGILPWLKDNNSCPICRTEFPEEQNNDDIPVPDRDFDESINDPENVPINDSSNSTEEQILENVLENMFLTILNRNMPREIAPQAMELTSRPMEMNPLPPRRQRSSNTISENTHQPNMINNTFINEPFLNTIRITPINFVYDPDLQEAIRLSLED
tara:strand:- start:380 stop:1120 length:741 start_codon:yes stop_codon:yes gene_type:complete